MDIKYINLKQKRKLNTFWLLVILLFLISIYISLEWYTASETVSNKVEFENKTKELTFVLGGECTGIKLLSTGVLVVDVDNSNLDLKTGDIILKLDDTSISSNKELIEYINSKSIIKQGKVNLTVMRNNKEIKVEAIPFLNEENNTYELGVWVKDSSAGVGVITFYEVNNKCFAGLGHGITETKENIILPIQTGAIVKAKITKINKGEVKAPGDLRATIYKDVYGNIRKNTVNGIYGVLESDELIQSKKETIEVVYKEQIKTGKAYIYCTLDNEVEKFEIDITNVLYDSIGNKNMVIEVTDEKLIKKTGGIVQGMSGSPIVQDGKLIGAVTHVFLNDPTKGYGVFIENMIEDMLSINE